MGVSGRKGVDNNEPANPTEDNPLTTHSTTPATTATVKNLTDKIKTEKQAAGEFKSLLKEGMSSYTGQNRRFDQCILHWTSWTASKEASLEGKVLDIFKRSKYINKS